MTTPRRKATLLCRRVILMKVEFSRINGTSVLAGALALYFLQDGIVNGLLHHRTTLIMGNRGPTSLGPDSLFLIPLVDMLLGLALLYGAILNFQRRRSDDD